MPCPPQPIIWVAPFAFWAQVPTCGSLFPLPLAICHLLGACCSRQVVSIWLADVGFRCPLLRWSVVWVAHHFRSPFRLPIVYTAHCLDSPLSGLFHCLDYLLLRPSAGLGHPPFGLSMAWATCLLATFALLLWDTRLVSYFLPCTI